VRASKDSPTATTMLQATSPTQSGNKFDAESMFGINLFFSLFICSFLHSLSGRACMLMTVLKVIQKETKDKQTNDLKSIDVSWRHPLYEEVSLGDDGYTGTCTMRSCLSGDTRPYGILCILQPPKAIRYNPIKK
jgi:hypothetical protein